MEIKYVYVKTRAEFGKQCVFDLCGPQLDLEIPPNPRWMNNYIERNPYDRGVQCSEKFALHEAQTLAATTKSSGMLHYEGGWPKEINAKDEEATERFRRRVEKGDEWGPRMLNLFQMMEPSVLQNSAVNIHRHYFEDMLPTDLVKCRALRTVNVYADPERPCRPVSSISWSPDLNQRFAVSYSYEQFGSVTHYSNKLYVWDVENPNAPTWTLEAFHPAVVTEYNPRDPSVLASGLTSGQVCNWDVRTGTVPVQISHRQFSHRYSVNGIKWVYSKTNTEFYSCSSEGRAMWWDTRNLRQPMDTLIFDFLNPNEPEIDNAIGISSIDYGPVVGARFMFGLENGLVISGSRKAKTLGERLASRFGAHQGPVITVDRNSFNPKLFLTIGDWSGKIWSEDTREDSLVETRFLSSQPTGGCWNKQRCSMFYMITADGGLQTWDMLEGLSEPVLKNRLCEERLTMITAHDDNGLLAIGSRAGRVFLVQPSEGLKSFNRAERNNFGAYIERCSRYTKAIDSRFKEIRTGRSLQVSMESDAIEKDMKGKKRGKDADRKAKAEKAQRDLARRLSERRESQKSEDEKNEAAKAEAEKEAEKVTSKKETKKDAEKKEAKKGTEKESKDTEESRKDTEKKESKKHAEKKGAKKGTERKDSKKEPEKTPEKQAEDAASHRLSEAEKGDEKGKEKGDQRGKGKGDHKGKEKRDHKGKEKGKKTGDRDRKSVDRDRKSADRDRKSVDRTRKSVDRNRKSISKEKRRPKDEAPDIVESEERYFAIVEAEKAKYDPEDEAYRLWAIWESNSEDEMSDSKEEVRVKAKIEVHGTKPPMPLPKSKGKRKSKRKSDEEKEIDDDQTTGRPSAVAEDSHRTGQKPLKRKPVIKLGRHKTGIVKRTKLCKRICKPKVCCPDVVMRQVIAEELRCRQKSSVKMRLSSQSRESEQKRESVGKEGETPRKSDQSGHSTYRVSATGSKASMLKKASTASEKAPTVPDVLVPLSEIAAEAVKARKAVTELWTHLYKGTWKIRGARSLHAVSSILRKKKIPKDSIAVSKMAKQAEDVKKMPPKVKKPKIRSIDPCAPLAPYPIPKRRRRQSQTKRSIKWGTNSKTNSPDPNDLDSPRIYPRFSEFHAPQ